jgi:uncharacterized surface protein with fasciclin (FAS1) repeats
MIVVLILAMMAVPAFAQDNTILDIVTTQATAEEDAEFTMLYSAVQAAPSVSEALGNTEAEYTVFAPSDEAFNTLTEGGVLNADELDAIMEDEEALSALLLYHVVEGTYTAADLLEMNDETLTTLSDEDITITVEDDTVFVNNIAVVSADVTASNGVIHVIEGVLLSGLDEEQVDSAEAEAMEQDPTALDDDTVGDADDGEDQVVVDDDDAVMDGVDVSENPDVESQEEAGELEDVEDPDSDPPMNTADQDTDALEDEGEQETDDTEVTDDSEADVEPADDDAAMTEDTGERVEPQIEIQSDTVLGTLQNEAAGGQFTTLFTAVLATDPAVAELLNDENATVTVFAPTDEAFEQLIDTVGSSTYASIIADREEMTNILLYHVVPDVALSAEDLAGMSGQRQATALEDSSLLITAGEGGEIYVNGYQVTTADIQTANGVIHVITGVLIPGSE